MTIDIRPLEPALADDYLAFFAGDAFADNPDWGNCFCRFYQFDGKLDDWGNTTVAENRAAVEAKLRAGTMDGLLASQGDKPIAWCQATVAPRLPFLPVALGRRDAVPDDRTGLVTCFVVAKPWRRRGVARALLRAAVERFRERGFRAVEAYPHKHDDSEASRFPGPVELYESEGFTRVLDLELPKRIVFRKIISSPAA